MSFCSKNNWRNDFSIFRRQQKGNDVNINSHYLFRLIRVRSRFDGFKAFAKRSRNFYDSFCTNCNETSYRGKGYLGNPKCLVRFNNTLADDFHVHSSARQAKHVTNATVRKRYKSGLGNQEG